MGLITIGWFFVFLPLIISCGIYMTFVIIAVVAGKKVHTAEAKRFFNSAKWKS
ncbi:hypothetical protein [Lysinibacillus sp. NPDC086135]|uniref:hypothetical protein n=1 Tax=Lysinibacillus sp. NPDC086135 TaxID=3364130 RepID=UPI00380BA950